MSSVFQPQGFSVGLGQISEDWDLVPLLRQQGVADVCLMYGTEPIKHAAMQNGWRYWGSQQKEWRGGCLVH